MEKNWPLLYKQRGPGARERERERERWDSRLHMKRVKESRDRPGMYHSWSYTRTSVHGISKERYCRRRILSASRTEAHVSK